MKKILFFFWSYSEVLWYLNVYLVYNSTVWRHQTSFDWKGKLCRALTKMLFESVTEGITYHDVLIHLQQVTQTSSYNSAAFYASITWQN